MNKQEHIEALLRINTNKTNRHILAQKLHDNEALIEETIVIVKTGNVQLAPKAARAIEILALKELIVIFPFLDEMIAMAQEARFDGVIRPLAKIFEVVMIAHYKQPEEFPLKKNQKDKITHICFDWMITEQKIAPQAHAMQTLYLLGKEFAWIHPELKEILERNFFHGSAGYKARARKIINKIS